MDARKSIAVAAIAAVAVLLQLVLAPYIAIANAVPDIVAVTAVLVAVVRTERAGYVLPFVLGLLFDLFSGGPVGPMALILLLVCFFAARLQAALDNDTPVMPLLVAAVSLLVIEVVYAIILAVLGHGAGLAGLVIYRALPVFVYDLVLAIILYPLIKRLLSEAAPIQSSITRLR